MSISFAQIAQIVAQHAETEAERNTPAAVACRALETLREAMLAMTPGRERNEIRDELDALGAELDAIAWADFGHALATQGS